MSVAVQLSRVPFFDLAAFKENRRKRKVYRETRDQLMAMSDRDLADIGIARGCIEEIAFEHAYGVAYR